MKPASAWMLLPLAAVAVAAEPPSVVISNGKVRATLYLPDANDGYYRGTRFDWSGSIGSLQAGGHEYFGQWFAQWDPKAHDSIMGPVEDYAPLNYDAARPGETFVKIGVGVLRKPDEQPYRFAAPYELLDTGRWTVRHGGSFVEYRHELRDPQSGYGYAYTKTVRLVRGKQQLVIEHALKNTGTKAIATDVYNHGFFMLDRQFTGPDVTVTFPFEARATRDMNGLAEVRGKQIVYLVPLQEFAPAPPPAPGDVPARPRRQAATTGVEGFSTTDLKDFDIAVENRASGAGVRFRGDRPLSRINFWSVRTTVCPEAYVEVKAAPGQVTRWKLTYDFYSLPRIAAPPVAAGNLQPSP